MAGAGTPQRPRAYQTDSFAWHHHRIPDSFTVAGPDGMREVTHPARTSAVFVVHGMGAQLWTQTAAALRSGFEDALDLIKQWQDRHLPEHERTAAQLANAPPSVIDGFWAEYADLAATFPDDWKRFGEDERQFYEHLWKLRTVSVLGTYRWFVKQLLRLLSARARRQVGFVAYWLIYLPSQPLALLLLTFAVLRHPRLLTDYLTDVRLYLAPRGVVERAIVQRIEYRVGAQFLRLVGLDWDFQRLPDDELHQASGSGVTFTRVIWVAHSLGTVISYNVISDLLDRAASLERDRNTSEGQRAGIARFRAAFRRFITLGSPLDKVAGLFGTRVLRPWPDCPRTELLAGGETVAKAKEAMRDWWVNFYHAFDPVSGSLESSLTCGAQPPINLHIGFWRLPGWAHVAYWSDAKTLRYVLGRTYGREYLHDIECVQRPAWVRRILAAVGTVVWAGLTLAALAALIWWGPQLVRAVLGTL